MCAAGIGDEHQHVVDVQVRSLMCVCRPLLSTLCTGSTRTFDTKAVPDRYLEFPDFDPRPWPVGVSGNPRRPGILLPQLTPRQVHSLLSGTGRSYRIRVAYRLVRDCARGESGALADAGRRRGVDRVGAHVRTIAEMLRCSHRRLLRTGGTIAHRVARIRRWPGCRTRSGRVLRARRGAKQVGMTVLDFSVDNMEVEPYAVTPNLTVRLRMSESTGTTVRAVALRAQVRIEPQPPTVLRRRRRRSARSLRSAGALVEYAAHLPVDGMFHGRSRIHRNNGRGLTHGVYVRLLGDGVEVHARTRRRNDSDRGSTERHGIHRRTAWFLRAADPVGQICCLRIAGRRVETADGCALSGVWLGTPRP